MKKTKLQQIKRLHQISHEELAEYIARSPSYVKERMRGVRSWTLDEALIIRECVGAQKMSLEELFDG